MAPVWSTDASIVSAAANGLHMPLAGGGKRGPRYGKLDPGVCDTCHIESCREGLVILRPVMPGESVGRYGRAPP